MHLSWVFALFPTLSTDWQVISFSKIIVPQPGDFNVGLRKVVTLRKR
jgi:hypothetical protein